MITKKELTALDFKLMVADSMQVVDELIGEFGLYPDKSNPDYQVHMVLDSGEDLDEYHWEKGVFRRGTDVFAGAKLVKNYTDI